MIFLLLFLFSSNVQAKEITDIKQMEAFVARSPVGTLSDYNDYDFTNIQNHSEECGFKINNKSGTFAHEYFALYNDDVTGDGKQDWIFVSRCAGSASSDTLVDIYVETDKKLVPIGFDELYRKQFNHDPNDFPDSECKPFIQKFRDKQCLCFQDSTEIDFLCLTGLAKLEKTKIKNKKTK